MMLLVRLFFRYNNDSQELSISFLFGFFAEGTKGPTCLR
jgi:hypothetical protein